MSLLEYALSIVEREWAVFPCLPRSKAPATKNGLNAATKDPQQVKRWWTENPAYNPAINLGLSNLTVLDVDTGVTTREQAQDLCNQFARTFTVRTGRRPDWGIQLYFSGVTSNRPCEWSGISGEIRSTGYYVMAPGAIHDKTGERYAILRDEPLPPIPPTILELSQRRMPKPIGGSEEKIAPSSRHYYLTSRAAELFAAGLSGDGLATALVWLYEHRCVRDAAKDAKVKAGELVGIARWAEQNVTPGLFKDDTQLIARLVIDDPRWKAAWEGRLGEFSGDTAQAFEYLAAGLFAQDGIKPWQAERIYKASPLYHQLEEQ